MLQEVCVVLFSLSLTTAINPIILIPGDGGSRFMVEANESHEDYFYCAKRIPNFQLLWVNLEYLAPLTVNCLTERLTLHYRGANRITVNKEGVQLVNPGWGRTEDVEYLSNVHIQRLKYFADVVDRLVRENGYKRGVSIRGAPYDFRKGPHELKGFQTRLARLIEETYALNGGQRVILLAHSYGCPLTLQLLQNSAQAWKDKYIRSFVSLEGPYFGSVVTLRMFISGYSLNIPTINGMSLRGMQRSWPSSYFLLPDERAWNGSEVLLRSPTRNYTSHDYKQLFEDAGYAAGWDLFVDTRRLIDPLKPPGVEVFCLVGKGIPTEIALDCSQAVGWPNQAENCNRVFGTGDGTVPWRSLNVCSRWKSSQTQPLHFHVMPNAEHFGILTDPRLVNFIQSDVIV